MDWDSLTRRKVLAGLGGAGAASVVGLGVGTKGAVRYATAQSTTNCENNFTLEADWRETYTTDEQTTLLENTTAPSGGDTGLETTADEPAVISLEGVLPGDRGTIGFKLTAEPNDENQSQTQVTPTLSVVEESTAENGIIDPEKEAGDTSSGSGELQEFIEVKIWKDTGFLGVDALGAQNLTPNPGEEVITDGFEPLTDAFGTEATLGTLDVSNTDSSTAVTLRWKFDPAADSRDVNVTQGDSVRFTLDIGCS
jgi:hypothetical protein